MAAGLQAGLARACPVQAPDRERGGCHRGRRAFLEGDRWTSPRISDHAARRAFPASHLLNKSSSSSAQGRKLPGLATAVAEALTAALLAKALGAGWLPAAAGALLAKALGAGWLPAAGALLAKAPRGGLSRPSFLSSLPRETPLSASGLANFFPRAALVLGPRAGSMTCAVHPHASHSVLERRAARAPPPPPRGSRRRRLP